MIGLQRTQMHRASQQGYEASGGTDPVLRVTGILAGVGERVARVYPVSTAVSIDGKLSELYMLSLPSCMPSVAQLPMVCTRIGCACVYS